MTTRAIKNTDDLAFFPVPGFEGLYEISLSGVVRTLPRVVNSRGGTRTTRHRPLKVRVLNGYPSFSVRANGVNRQVSVHRCLALLFIPNPEAKPHITARNALATRFAVCKSNINQILRGETWRELPQ